MIGRWAIAMILLSQAVAATAWAENDKVTLGQVLSMAQAPYYVALEKGYLAKEGIEIDSGNFRGGQDMTSVLATGQLDIGLGAFNAGFFNAANEGLDLRAVAAIGYQPSPVIATPPLVRKDLWDSGAIRSGKDLKGRKVAVNTPGATPEFTLSLILAKYGMTLKDVDETMLGFPQMVIALDNKAIDVGFVSAPFHAIPLRDGTAVLMKPDAGVTAGDITTVVFFSGKFLRERPQVGVRFLRALLRGAKETQGNFLKNSRDRPDHGDGDEAQARGYRGVHPVRLRRQSRHRQVPRQHPPPGIGAHEGRTAQLHDALADGPFDR